MGCDQAQGMEIAFSGVCREIDPPRRLQRTEVFEGMLAPNRWLP